MLSKILGLVARGVLYAWWQYTKRMATLRSVYATIVHKSAERVRVLLVWVCAHCLCVCQVLHLLIMARLDLHEAVEAHEH